MEIVVSGLKYPDAFADRTISELEGRFFPGLAIKAFTGDRRADAEAWRERGA